MTVRDDVAIEIDPFEALIKLALLDYGLTNIVGERVDIWHHYGQDFGDWSLSSQSLIFVPAGGPTTPGSIVETVQVEARCYGDSPADCGALWMALRRWSSGHNEYLGGRREVETSWGAALVYNVIPLTQPRLLFDEDIKPNGGMPFFSILLETSIANAAVG